MKRRNFKVSMTERKKHDREFKLKAVELSYQKESIRELAHDLGIRAELIYRWRSEFATLKGKSFPGNGTPKQTEEDGELARLKRELDDVKMERDILKKAVGIFSRSDGKYFSS